MQIQADQMNLLHGQIHILTRELGDLQKQFASLSTKVDTNKMEIDQRVDDLQVEVKTAAEEGHAALRLELAEHGANAEEMKKAWEEAHAALSDAMDDGLGKLAEQHVKDLADHAATHQATLAETEAALRGDLQLVKDEHADNLRSLADEHDGKHALNAENHAKMEAGLQGVLDSTHGRLQAEIAELKSGHAANLKEILADVTQQVDNLDLCMKQEMELRREVEAKLDQVFGGMQKICTVSFAK